MYYSDFIEEGTYLAHHGIKGQKWYIRRYQNPDGSLTSEGKKRYLQDIENINQKTKYTNDKKAKCQKAKKYLAILGNEKNKIANNVYNDYKQNNKKYWNALENQVKTSLKDKKSVLKYFKTVLGYDDYLINEYVKNKSLEESIQSILEDISESGDNGAYDLKCMNAYNSDIEKLYNKSESTYRKWYDLVNKYTVDIYGSNAPRSAFYDVDICLSEYYDQHNK